MRNGRWTEPDPKEVRKTPRAQVAAQTRIPSPPAADAIKATLAPGNCRARAAPMANRINLANASGIESAYVSDQGLRPFALGLVTGADAPPHEDRLIP